MLPSVPSVSAIKFTSPLKEENYIIVRLYSNENEKTTDLLPKML